MQLGVQLRKSDKERLGAFLYGLDLLIKFDVQTQCPDTMAEAMRMAQLREMKHNHGKLKTDTTRTQRKLPIVPYLHSKLSRIASHPCTHLIAG